MSSWGEKYPICGGAFTGRPLRKKGNPPMDQVCDILNYHKNEKNPLTCERLDLIPESGMKTICFKSPCLKGDVQTIKLNSTEL